MIHSQLAWTYSHILDTVYVSCTQGPSHIVFPLSRTFQTKCNNRSSMNCGTFHEAGPVSEDMLHGNRSFHDLLTF